MSVIEQASTHNPAPTVSGNMIEDRHYRIMGFVIILVVFFGFGTWAAVAPLASAAHAPGKVRVENKRKTVQHLEGGIVKSLLVQDGDYVEKGQVVMTLDDTQIKSQLEVVQGQYLLALAREARLTAQRDQMDAVVYPQEFTDLQNDSRVREVMSVQNQMFSVRKAAYENELALYVQQIEQFESQIKGLYAQKKSSRHLVSSYATDLKNLRSLEKKGYAERRQVNEVQREMVQNEGELGELNATIALTKSRIVEVRLQSLQLQKELQREVAAEINEVQEQLFQLVEQKQALQDTLTRMVIRAPQSGAVLELLVHTIGAVVGTGQELMGIVPEGKRLVIEARISPIDIDRIAIGQTADIRFSAFKMRETSSIFGRLITISADSLIDSNDSTQTAYYLAIVEITQEGLQHLADSDLTLIAGMPAEVFIKTGERTLFQYLFDPLANTVARAFIED
ncbi:MAG: HlyD family type I secretion periplasmic adaptor subunit [Candidatus Thiodiazotropha sp. (ex Rostrolucina anterorostrata)]|nr:HlyD family type I secretion periplasmic adaptor subunit [Candidatus Thiodiazotropha sp. (ex Rostrolucina anterorostrata)]